MRNRIVAFLISICLLSCWEKYKFETGHFPEKVINFEDVNSEYDDYNAAEPFIYYKYLFHFSSNRRSETNDFDIIGENMYIDWSKTNGTIDIGTDLTEDEFDYLIPMFDSINTPFNELGPYSLGFRQEISYTEVLWTDLLLYTTDCNGNFDVKFIYSELFNSSGTITSELKAPQEISFINTGANELYPSFYGKDFYFHDEWGLDATMIEKIIYCSDKNGDFNIYEINVPADSGIINTLKSKERFESKEITVNSSADDKCPFVNGKLLVFCSDRPGGYGGFDLYYSIYKNENWTEPTNFGEKINTAFDEYRPITLHLDDFDNNLMIFSSNRSGGKGGFDLYYVGIKQMIK